MAPRPDDFPDTPYGIPGHDYIAAGDEPAFSFGPRPLDSEPKAGPGVQPTQVPRSSTRGRSGRISDALKRQVHIRDFRPRPLKERTKLTIAGIALLAMAALGWVSLNPITDLRGLWDGVTNAVRQTDSHYVAYVRSNGGSIVGSKSDDQLISAGHEVCSLIQNGATLPQLLTALATDGDLNTAGQQQAYMALVKGSLEYYCPQYQNKVDAQIVQYEGALGGAG